jgi:AraC-like DNA-binding protein
VSVLWASTGEGPQDTVQVHRERVLPTGCAHVVLRLSDDPLRLYAHAGDDEGQVVASAVVGGPRTDPYLRLVNPRAASVGAQLRPGAVPALLGVAATELSMSHVALEHLWGPTASRLHERVREGGADPQRAIDLFEQFLLARLRVGRTPRPALWNAFAELERTGSVRAMVRASGFSHRHMTALFQSAVGLGPKDYLQVQRFCRAVALLRPEPRPFLARVAVEAGYADHAHLSRAFQRYAGLTPSAYVELAPRQPHHVALVPASRGQIRSSSRPGP